MCRFIGYGGKRHKTLTCNDHHADSKDPLVVRFGGHVSKAHRGHASHGEIECGNVHGFPGRSVNEFGRARVVRPHVRVRVLGNISQFPEPAVLHAVIGI